MTKTMFVAAAVAMFAISGQAQTTVHHNTSTVATEGSGQGAGVGYGAGAQNNQAAVKDDLFAGTEIFAKNATDVTEITMDPDSLAMVSGKDKDKAQDTVLQVVRTYEYDKPGMYNMADVDKFREKLNTGDWHCSLHERNMKSGESTDVCSKRRTDDLHETAIITVEPKELTFIHTISHHASMIGMPGMSGLGMLPGSLSGLSSLAMLGPEMLQLQMNLSQLKSGMYFNMAPMNLGAWSQMDGEAIEKSIEKSQKEWDKSGMKMKEFMSPGGKKTFIITPDSSDSPVWTIAPEAPKSLEAVPAMPAPPASEGAPAPPAPAAPATPPVPAAPHLQ